MKRIIIAIKIMGVFSRLENSCLDSQHLQQIIWDGFRLQLSCVTVFGGSRGDGNPGDDGNHDSGRRVTC